MRRKQLPWRGIEVARSSLRQPAGESCMRKIPSVEAVGRALFASRCRDEPRRRTSRSTAWGEQSLTAPWIRLCAASSFLVTGCGSTDQARTGDPVVDASSDVGAGGYEDASSLDDHPVGEGGPAAARHCTPNQDGGDCPPESTCVEGCPFGSSATITSPGGVCSIPGRESCGCGVVAQPCTTPGLECLMPACCDYGGLCVTPEEKAAVCNGPDGVRFRCGS
jgi:hypothetical protein